MKKYIYSITFSLILSAFTAFVLLDTFVISQPMQNVQGQVNNSMFDSSTADKTYSDNADSEINTKTAESQSSVSSDKSISTDGASLIGEYQNEHN